MRRIAALTVVLVGLFAACSDDSSTPSSATPAATAVPEATNAVPTSPPDTDPPETDPPETSPATSEAEPVAAWEKVTASGECMCADGSPYSYWIRRANPEKVVFFLQGGGACFDAGTCAFDSEAYRVNIGPNDDPNTFAAGIFDFPNARNPLSDYSFVFAPYCTGDVHIGNASHEYSPELTVQHKGSVNATTALNALATQFPDTTELLVTGESAGSVPTPLYAGLAADLLPNAEITVLADGSGAYPDVPAVNAVIGEVWGTEAAIPPWPENEGLDATTWSFPGLYVQANKHAPDIIFGRHDYAFDIVQQFFAGLAGVDANQLVTLIDSNETQIEEGGVDLRSYIAPGNFHTILSSSNLYFETVEGVALIDWVTNLVRREPDPDVHCKQCGG